MAMVSSGLYFTLSITLIAGMMGVLALPNSAINPQSITPASENDLSVPDNIISQENGENCILASMSLSLWVQYTLKNDTLGYATFTVPNTNWNGACTGVKKTIDGDEYTGPVLVGTWKWPAEAGAEADGPENRVMILFTDDGSTITLKTINVKVVQISEKIFPNAKDPNSVIILASFPKFSTKKGSKYSCQEARTLISNKGEITVSGLQFEIGDKVGDRFSEGGATCRTTPTTTPRPGQNKPNVIIKENGKNCLLAFMSINVAIQYTMKNGTQVLGSVSQPGNWVGACTGTKITFHGIEYTGPVLVSRWTWGAAVPTPDGVPTNRIVAQFSDDGSSTTLKTIQAEIALNENSLFPSAKDPNSFVEFTSDIGFSTKRNTKFSCADIRKFSSKNGKGDVEFTSFEMEIGDNLGDTFSEGGSTCSGCSKVLLISFLSTLILAAFVKLF